MTTRITAQDVLDGTLTDADVAAANKDGASSTASMRTLGTGAAQAAAGNDSRFSDSRAPTGSAGGDLTGTYPNPTLGSGAFATPAIVLGSSAAAGATSDAIRSDSTIAAFDATNPSTQAFGDAAAVGSAAFAARRDHKHAMPADPFTGAAAGGHLTGTYPNPSIASSVVTSAMIVDGTILAGDIATAGIQALTGRNSAWTVVRKGGDTSRATTTTVSADPDLAATLSSGVIYEILLLLYYDCTTTTPDIKVTFAEDANIRGNWQATGISTSETSTLQNAVLRTNSPLSFGTGAPGGAVTKRLILGWGWYGGNGAAVAVQWAQVTSDAANVTMLTGSILAYRALP